MSKTSDLGLLELLKGKGNGPNALTALAAKAPAHDPAGEESASQREAKLNEVLSRIQQLTGTETAKAEAPPLRAMPAAPLATGAAGPAMPAAVGTGAGGTYDE
jgi:hypothetical protein